MFILGSGKSEVAKMALRNCDWALISLWKPASLKPPFFYSLLNTTSFPRCEKLGGNLTALERLLLNPGATENKLLHRPVKVSMEWFGEGFWNSSENKIPHVEGGNGFAKRNFWFLKNPLPAEDTLRNQVSFRAKSKDKVGLSK